MTLLPDLTFLLNLIFSKYWFHRTSATGVACRQGTLTPPDTWSCPTLGLACVLMSRPISPELVLSLDFWISNTPRYFSFAFYLWETEDPRVNFEKRFAHYEIYTWTLCHSYLHEKQTSIIQSLNKSLHMKILYNDPNQRKNFSAGINTQNAGDDYIWHHKQTTSSHPIKKSGQYFVFVLGENSLFN